jgi:signal transduction histidine kinase
MDELKAAEKFKEAVTLLTVQDTLDELRTFKQIEKGVSRVRTTLDDYRKLLEENPNNTPLSGFNFHECELVGVLAGNIDEFEAAIYVNMSCPRSGGPGELLGENQREAALDAAFVSLAIMPGSERLLAVSYAKMLRYRSAGNVLKTNASDLQLIIHQELETHLRDSRSHYQMALWVTIPSCAFGLLLTIGLMRSFYSWLLNPIRDLEGGVRRVASGDFSKRIEVHSGDEMEELGAAFNDMMQRLQDLYTDLARQVNERSRQLVRSERLASVGFLAAGVAHEINNPLASIAFCSEALEARLTELLRGARRVDDLEVFAKYLKMIQDEAFRCKNITERLLAFSRPGERRREMTDLGQLVQAVLDVTQHLQNARGKRIDFAILPDRAAGMRVAAPVNAEEIKSVVLNLVVNALDSMDEGGTLTLRLGLRNGMAELRVSDSGCGMTQEVLENIFEPFFTRSRTGKGTGLGLTISHRIISQHGGDLEASSPGPNQGSTFTVRLPLQVIDAPAAAAPEARKPARGMAA